MKPVYDKIIAKKTVCIVLQKVIATSYSLVIFFLIKSEWVGRLEITESFFSSWNQIWHLTTSNTSLGKRKLSVVEMQQLTNIEKIDSKKKFPAKNGLFTMADEK